jgi:hypothetical protein
MKLSNEEKNLIANHIADFSIRLLESADSSEEQIREDLNSFYDFFCGALEAAKRDGRREILVSTLN